jgi:hypothetical protein
MDMKSTSRFLDTDTCRLSLMREFPTFSSSHLATVSLSPQDNLQVQQELCTTLSVALGAVLLCFLLYLAVSLSEFCHVFVTSPLRNGEVLLRGVTGSLEVDCLGLEVKESL